MRVFQGIEAIRSMRRPVVTTGSFDGVHIGHKAILRRLKTLAADSGGESLLITFHPHPRKILYPDTLGKELRLIYTQREKIACLEETGLDNLLIIPFTLGFSQMSSIDFIRKILVEKIGARMVVIGYNHHFGHQREGSYEYLYELGRYYSFGVEEIPEQDLEHEAVSSTRIRKALTEGQVQRANAYLDHLFLMMGRLERGPSMTVEEQVYLLRPEEEEKLVPPPGAYAGGVEYGEGERKALVLIVPDPANPDRRLPRLVIPGEAQDLDGTAVVLRFRKRLREGPMGPAATNAAQLGLDLRALDDLIY
ncbi:MAG TPA: riboflavin biosynthesis protein RibF [Bacteroidales bacterium]|nr:riboflavin biosynthesis protein RibF [Bacteroidales bacterium]HRZ75760.1 riboflavin biosynthesis protein RibF [Bacteroidales bacterium]